MTMFLLLFPLAAFLSLLLFSSIKTNGQRVKHLNQDRQAFIDSMVLWGGLMWLIIECLSLVNCVNQPSIALSWLLVTLLMLTGLHRRLQMHLRQALFELFDFRVKLLPAFIISLIPLILLIIALWAPPNNWDSMTYHMSRVEHWAQNANVKHYPSHISKQLFLNPGAEFFILHLQILTDGDRFANLVQWFSLVGSMIAASLLARLLGSGVIGQVLAALFVATLPMGILQATSTQNDYAVSFLLLTFFLYAFRFGQQSDLRRAGMVGLSLGLAILTKATAYLFALPMLIFLTISCIRLHKTQSFRLLSVIAGCVIAINSGHCLRNYMLYDHPLAPEQYRGYNVNQAMSAPMFCSNIIRNASLHLGTPDQKLNETIAGSIEKVHSFLGVDIVDPRITYGASLFTLFFSNHEDTAGNSIHFMLVFVSSILLLVRIRKYDRKLILYFLMLLFSFLLFCAYIRWNPWNSRYQLPLFILAAPAVASILNRGNRQTLLKSLMALLMICSLPWILWNHSRPLCSLPDAMKSIFTLSPVYQGSGSIFTTSRTEQYFVSYPEIGPSFIQAIQFLDLYRCSTIGLIGHEGIWEYPLWVLARSIITEKVGFHHCNVPGMENRGGANFKQFPEPCVIILITPQRSNTVFVHQREFHKVWSAGPIDMMTPLYP